MNLSKPLLALALAACAIGAQAAAINLFGAGTQSVSDTQTAGVESVGASSTFVSPDTLGGARDLYVIRTAGPSTGDPGISASIAGGIFKFSSGSGQGGMAAIRWDGANGNFNQNTANTASTNLNNAIGSIAGNGFAGANFASALGGSFLLDVLEANAGFNLTIQMFSSAGTAFSNLTVTFLAGPGVYVVPFNAFSGIPVLQCAGGVAAGCADFSDISAMQFLVNFPGAPTEGLGFRMRVQTDQVTAVPEPGSLALVACALVGAALTQRRRLARP